MIKVVFSCNENMNRYKEIFEFEDGTTDKEIEEEYVEWVLNQVQDNFSWYKKG